MDDDPGYSSYWGSYYNSTSTTYFDVEYYRKPDYFVSVDSTQDAVIAGEPITFEVTGSYFFGQPIVNREVKYTVSGNSYRSYRYYLGYMDWLALDKHTFYGYYGGDDVHTGIAYFDSTGKATFEVPTTLKKDLRFNQIYTVSVEFDDGSGAPVIARKNVHVAQGTFDILQNPPADSPYSFVAGETLQMPFKLAPSLNAASTNLSNVDIQFKIDRRYSEIQGNSSSKYPKYVQKIENILSTSLKTDSEGEVTLEFLPQKPGSYEVVAFATDKLGNRISREFSVYVRDKESTGGSRSYRHGLTVSTTEDSYKPGDDIEITVTSDVPGIDVLITVERERADRYYVVPLTGNTGTLKLEILEKDIPNIYISARTFAQGFQTAQKVLTVDSDSKRLSINVTSDKSVYGPGENVTLQVETTDNLGNPVSADLSLAVVDKALYELAAESVKDIFLGFWSERNHSTGSNHSLESIRSDEKGGGGGCFAKDTQILMGDGTTKDISKVHVGETILTKANESSDFLVEALVINKHEAAVDGYLLINETLKITPNHVLFVNGSWREAGSIQIGDYLENSLGKIVYVRSIEWQAGKFEVYNLDVSDKHTFFANGYWVHNQKGDPRTTFADTAYWTPSIKTDSGGKATVTFSVPDNLTTWAITAIGNTLATQVGESVEEIMVSKDVVVKPIIPNILRTQDKVFLSALVQNYTDVRHKFDVALEFDVGDVKGKKTKSINLDPNSFEQLYWEVHPKRIATNAQVKMSAIATDVDNVGDVVVYPIPVQDYSFNYVDSDVGFGETTYTFSIDGNVQKDRSRVRLSISPSLLGSLPDAMNYLVGYPYGCVEQTASRFVPGVIALEHPNLYANALEGKDINDILDRGIKKLESKQQSDGGWSWWGYGSSEPFVTAYVLEYLLKARDLGFDISNDTFASATDYLNQVFEGGSDSSKASAAYGLSLLGVYKDLGVINTDKLHSDLLALVVMANVRSGNRNSATNGASKLISKASEQGSGVFWEAGLADSFGSKDASTALAVRALLLANEDETAAKGVYFLSQNRQKRYWSNTFATSQVIRAITDYTLKNTPPNSEYPYEVILNGSSVLEGKVVNVMEAAKILEWPVSELPKDSTVEVKVAGENALHTVLTKDFYVEDMDENSSVSNGFELTREYVNAKGSRYSIGVGDVVDVNLHVKGLDSSARYLVVEDQLPSGMIPINVHLDNQQNYKDRNYNVSQEFTENGAVLWMRSVSGKDAVLSYKARVISDGDFYAPPATASLMYYPEVNARTGVTRVEIGRESGYMSTRVGGRSGFAQVVKGFVLLTIAIVLGVLVVLKRKGKSINIKNILIFVGSKFTAVKKRISKFKIKSKKKLKNPKDSTSESNDVV